MSEEKKKKTKAVVKTAKPVTKAVKPKKVATEAKTVKKEKSPVAVEETVVPAKPKKLASKTVAKKAASRSKVIQKYQSHSSDTGSTDVQVAVLTEKINALTKHLQEHKKDHDSRMGLLKMIGQRRSLLNYLEKKSNERYKKLIASLGLRK